MVEKSLMEYLPFLATENLLMETVKRGGDRQTLHEVIRRCSMESVKKMRAGKPCDLISRLAATGAFGMTEQELSALLVPQEYIGRCAQQVEQLLEIGDRIYNIERMFNKAAGMKPEDDRLPKRLLTEPITNGPSKGMISQLPLTALWVTSSRS